MFLFMFNFPTLTKYSLAFAPLHLSPGVMNSRSTLQNPSSWRLGQAPDQHSIRLILSCLERLDGLDRRVHEEIQEIRTLFTDLLDNYQPDVIMEDSGGCDSTVDSQAGLDGFNAVAPFVSLHDRPFVPQPPPDSTSLGVTGSLYVQAYCPVAVPPTIEPLLNLL